MILRRLTTAIRKQDWFTVGVETLIVVFGVFIGLQVNNWNETRLNKSEERIYLERLNSDLVQTLADLETDRDEVESWRVEGRTLLQAVLNDDANALPEDACWGVTLATRTAVAAPQLATIKELIAGGRTNLISDLALREGLVRYEAKMESFHGLNAVISNRMDAISPILASRRTVMLNAESSTQSPRFACAMDHAILAQDEEFANILSYAGVLQRNNIFFFDLMIEESEAILALVHQEIGGQDAASEASP